MFDYILVIERYLFVYIKSDLPEMFFELNVLFGVGFCEADHSRIKDGSKPDSVDDELARCTIKV